MQCRPTRNVVLSSLLGLFVAAACPAARADDLDTIGQRLATLYSGQAGRFAADGRNPRSDELARAVEASIARSPLTPEPDRARPTAIPNNVARIYAALLPMAQAYVAPGSPLAGSAKLRARIEEELRRGLAWIKPGAERPGNWYPWIISIPQRLGPTLLLLDGKIDGQLHGATLDAMAGLMAEPSLNGANAVWEARNHVYLALLRRDAPRMDLAMDFLLPELTVHTESGILEDYSYQFHGRLLHTSGYGSGFARSAAEIVYLVEGTKWEVPEPKKRLLENHLIEHAQWVIWDDRYDFSVKGRGILSSGAASQHRQACLLLRALGGPNQDRLLEAARHMRGRASTAPGWMMAGLADGLKDPLSAPLTGFRHFHKSDFAVFRRPEFHVSVRMYSNRLIDYEGNWGQNLTGWFLCYGMTYITRTGREYYEDRDTLREHFDWDRLPGTTTRVGVHPPQAYNRGTSPFAGGAGSSAGGVCGFMLEPAAGDFVARKSYHFFDMGFAALGSGITSTGEHPEPVVTTVTQWAAPRPSMPLILSGGREVRELEGEGVWPDVRWAWHDNVGYVFPQAVELHGHRRGRLTTLWLDHGSDPRDEEYAYVVMPRSSLTETRAMAEEPSIGLSDHGRKTHVVIDDSREAGSAVFWEPGQSGVTSADHPVFLYAEPGDLDGLPKWLLAVQNPLHTGATVRLGLSIQDRPSTLPAEVVVRSVENRALLAVATEGGRAYHVGFSGRQAEQPPRGDSLDFEGFRVGARTEDNVTWLTAHIPGPARKSGYRLRIRGAKGHLRAELKEKDIVDRPGPGLVRYRWQRTGEQARGGSFRAALFTDTHHAVAHFTVPDPER